MTKVTTVEEYWDLCFADRPTASVGSKEGFLYRFDSFRKMLKEEYPDFTEQEMLKILINYHRIGELFNWQGLPYFIQALKVELENSNNL